MMKNQANNDTLGMGYCNELNACIQRIRNSNSDCQLDSSSFSDIQRKQKHSSNDSTYRDFAPFSPPLPERKQTKADIPLFSPKEPTFPVTFHSILSNTELRDIITWLPHGRSWCILKQDVFAREVVPRYFRHGNMSSFRRQISGWGFIRIKTGPDTGSYYHELFLRGKPNLCHQMKRLNGKSECSRHQTKHGSMYPPDFYALSREQPLPLMNEESKINAATTFQQNDFTKVASAPKEKNSAETVLKANVCYGNSKSKVVDSLRKYFPAVENLHSATSINKSESIDAEILIMEKMHAHVSSLLSKLGGFASNENPSLRVSSHHPVRDIKDSEPSTNLADFLHQSILKAKGQSPNIMAQQSTTLSEFIPGMNDVASNWNRLDTNNTSTSNDINRRNSGCLSGSRPSETQLSTLQMQALLSSDATTAALYFQQRQKANQILLQKQMREISCVLPPAKLESGENSPKLDTAGFNDLLLSLLLRSSTQGHYE